MRSHPDVRTISPSPRYRDLASSAPPPAGPPISGRTCKRPRIAYLEACTHRRRKEDKATLMDKLPGQPSTQVDGCPGSLSTRREWRDLRSLREKGAELHTRTGAKAVICAIRHAEKIAPRTFPQLTGFSADGPTAPDCTIRNFYEGDCAIRLVPAGQHAAQAVRGAGRCTGLSSVRPRRRTGLVKDTVGHRWTNSPGNRPHKWTVARGVCPPVARGACHAG